MACNDAVLAGTLRAKAWHTFHQGRIREASMHQNSFTILLAALTILQGCSDSVVDPYDEEPILTEEKSLSQQVRISRLQIIRDAARQAGLENAAMLAGISSAETGLAHCWSEATWSCKGPWSADCNGPVIAGAGDGPCHWQEGGLGLFQFDGGTFSETLRRDGEQVLTIKGSVVKAVDFVADMLMNSPYVSVSSRGQALRWLSNVKPGSRDFEAWIKTVTHKYNGCEPGYCSIFWQRYDHYSHHAKLVYDDTNQGFWTQGGGTSMDHGPRDSHPVGEPDAIEVWWSRLQDGSYAFKAIAPSRAIHLTYSVDGYVIAERVKKDDPTTAEVENNFPMRYRFSAENLGRTVVVQGFDAQGRVIARGRGLIDVTWATGVYIRQVGEGTYQVGLERAPADVDTVSVDVDGYQLLDSISGEEYSERLAVRSHFNTLGPRRFKLTGYNFAGDVVFSESRRFELE